MAHPPTPLIFSSVLAALFLISACSGSKDAPEISAPQADGGELQMAVEQPPSEQAALDAERAPESDPAGSDPARGSPSAGALAAEPRCSAGTAPALSLDDYLIAALVVEEELRQHTGSLNLAVVAWATSAQSTEDFLTANEPAIVDLARFFGDARLSLCDLRPPPEAAVYHADLLAAHEALAEFQPTIESEGLSVTVFLNFSLRLEGLTQGQIFADGRTLLQRALSADADEALGVYLAAAIEVRHDLDQVALGFSAAIGAIDSAQGGQEVFERLLGALEQVDARMRALEAPQEALPFHEQQLVLNQAQIRTIREGLDVFRLTLAKRDEAELRRGAVRYEAAFQEVASETVETYTLYYPLLVKALAR